MLLSLPLCSSGPRERLSGTRTVVEDRERKDRLGYGEDARRGDGLPVYTYDEAVPGIPPLAAAMSLAVW